MGPRYLKEIYAGVEKQAEVFLGLVSKLPQPRAEPVSPAAPLNSLPSLVFFTMVTMMRKEPLGRLLHGLEHT